MINQIGGAVCSLCGSPGTNKSTCPLNPAAKKTNPKQHPLAATGSAKVQVKQVKEPATAKGQVKEPAAPKVTLHLTPKQKPVQTIEAAMSGLSLNESSSSTLSLPDMYKTTTDRLKLKRKFETQVLKNKDVNQCVAGDLDKYFTLQKRLGRGSFGVVHSAKAGDQLFAVKEGRASAAVTKRSWAKTTEWAEALILRDIAMPILEKRICPNVPVMYSAHACLKCEFEGLLGAKAGTTVKPCMILLMELASGDLVHWLTTANPNANEIYNALFQILAGLYALEKHGQVFNNDIKAPNILYYNVTPGGYWIYNIMGKRYCVPNMGKLFIINDFGVSSAYVPHLYASELGRRPYIMINKQMVAFSSEIIHEKAGKWNSTSCIDQQGNAFYTPQKIKLEHFKKPYHIEAEFKPEHLAVLKAHGIPADPKKLEFYANADIVPPLEFAEDVIDALAMFVGGVRRSSQEGKHPDYNIPAAVKSVLLTYIPAITKVEDDRLSKTSNLSTIYYKNINRMHSATANAGYMIDELFGKQKVVDYLTGHGPVIEEFTI